MNNNTVEDHVLQYRKCHYVVLLTFRMKNLYVF